MLGVEIERRFLATPTVLADCRGHGRSIVQGYLWSGFGGNARIRIEDGQGTVTCKTRKRGCCRHEMELPIPYEVARTLLHALPPDHLVRKTRYHVPVGEWLWEVDVFAGRHHGLIIAEIELAEPGQTFPLPDWIAREVTADPRFGNSSLAHAPAGPAAA